MASGYPGLFPGGLTTCYRNIGGVQRTKTGTAGYPGAFPGGLSTGYETIGAVQKDVASTSVGIIYNPAPFTIQPLLTM